MKEKYPHIDRNIEMYLWSVVEYMKDNKSAYLLDMYNFYVLIEKYITETTSRRSYIFISVLYNLIKRLYPEIEVNLRLVPFYAKMENISENAMFVRNRLNYILGYDGERNIWLF